MELGKLFRWKERLSKYTTWLCVLVSVNVEDGMFGKLSLALTYRAPWKLITGTDPSHAILRRCVRYPYTRSKEPFLPSPTATLFFYRYEVGTVRNIFSLWTLTKSVNPCALACCWRGNQWELAGLNKSEKSGRCVHSPRNTFWYVDPYESAVDRVSFGRIKSGRSVHSWLTRQLQSGISRARFFQTFSNEIPTQSS